MTASVPSALAAACLAAAACGDGGGAGRIDAAPAPPDADAAPRVDGRVGVHCVQTECAPGDYCCAFQAFDRPPTYSGFCYAPGDGGPCEDIVLECDGPEDCESGEVCCDGERIRCVPEASCENAVICHLHDHCEDGRRCAETPRGLVDACQ